MPDALSPATLSAGEFDQLSYAGGFRKLRYRYPLLTPLPIANGWAQRAHSGENYADTLRNRRLQSLGAALPLV